MGVTSGTASGAIHRLVSAGLVMASEDPDGTAAVYSATMLGLARLNTPDSDAVVQTRYQPKPIAVHIMRDQHARRGVTDEVELARLAGCTVRYARRYLSETEEEKADMLRRLEDAEIAGQPVVPLDDVCETMADIYVCRILASEGAVVIVDQHIAISPLRMSAAARRVTA